MKGRIEKSLRILIVLVMLALVSCSLFKEEETSYSYKDYSATIEVKTLD